MHQTLRTLCVAVIALTLIPWSPVAAQYKGARGSITVENLTKNSAAVTIEVASDGNSHWVHKESFCLKNGESRQTWSHMDLFRVRAQLRKVGDCASPNVLGSVQSKSQRLVFLADNPIFGIKDPHAPTKWVQHHIVTIAAGKYQYEYTIQITSHV